MQLRGGLQVTDFLTQEEFARCIEIVSTIVMKPSDFGKWVEENILRPNWERICEQLDPNADYLLEPRLLIWIVLYEFGPYMDTLRRTRVVPLKKDDGGEGGQL